MKRAKAFCPGHITGFFEICRTEDPLTTGSRGAGMCLSLGATSTVEIVDAKRQRIDISIDGKVSKAEVTRDAVERLIDSRPVHVKISTQLDLPVSQGFGMSAAGALSAALGVSSIIGHPRQKAFEAAHIAEIVKGGGLGDVSALHAGGITIRRKPGLPPIGKVIRIDGRPDLVLCVVGRKMLTKSVLGDPDMQRIINSNGSKKVDELVRKPTLENLMDLSYDFAVGSGLATGRTLDAMNAGSEVGRASMSMLGNSVFSVGDVAGLERILSDLGRTYRCAVDVIGPRILKG